ncbi:MAG: ATP-dependent nuclease [Actinomycetota bacterium]
MSQQKYGLELRGWGVDGLHDEPEDDDELVLTIRLTIDDSLEPRWEVINQRQTDPRSITARDREALGVTRVGPDVERHLTWGRGSALLRLTGSTDEMSRTLAEAHRSTRSSVNAAELEGLSQAAQRASELARSLGAGVGDDYDPGLDPAAVGVGTAALGLHDGAIPVRASGLGSRRLAALAIQRESFPQGGIVLVDEIETGLEPHRLRHLIRKLKTSGHSQVIVTTHSEIPIVELTATDLRVVFSNMGATVVHRVGDDLQSLVRAAPEALLGRRVIVCEGPTEVGLCRALDRLWTSQRNEPPAELGIVLVPGGGSQAAARAQALASLGYSTALLGDSDVTRWRPPSSNWSPQA